MENIFDVIPSVEFVAQFLLHYGINLGEFTEDADFRSLSEQDLVFIKIKLAEVREEVFSPYLY